MSEPATILVVDDERVVAKDLQGILRSLGYRVPVTAASGEDALRLADEVAPNLVLMDIRIRGDRDGIEVVRELRERHDVPIVYLTAYADEDTVARAGGTQPQGYLLKPVKPEELSATVAIALRTHQMERRLRERERWFATILRSLRAGVLSTNAAGEIDFVNPAASRMLGWVETTGRRLEDVLQLPGPAGELVVGDNPVAYTATPVEGHGMVVLLNDLSERRRLDAERERMTADLERQNQLIEAMLGHIHDGVVLVGADRRGLRANRTFAEMFSLPAERVVGMRVEDFLGHLRGLVADPDSVTRRLTLPGDRRHEPQLDVVLARPRRRVLRRTVSPVTLDDGGGALIVWRDVTAEVDLAAERERIALTDPLTGIANRRAAEAALAREAARTRRSQTPLSVAFFDVDGFKELNDTHGHAAGDEALVRIATTLAGQGRCTDQVARWGGDELVAVLPVSLTGALAFCERVRKEIAALDVGVSGKLTVSVGVAQVRPGEPITTTLARADERLYAAKAAGRNCVKS
jgi:diguanylate cyclase (GGDEF)-like protein